jgi:hypothetical protein
MRKNSRFVLPLLVGIVGLYALISLSPARADDDAGGR